MKKKIIIGMMTFILFIGGTVGIGVGKKMLDEHNMTVKRINATKELQENVSNYIIENYEGITKIEWLGWRVSPMNSTYTIMIINDYPAEDGVDFFRYEVQDTYNAEGNEKHTDLIFAIPGSENNNIMNYILHKQGVRKSHVGSPNAEIIYNAEEHIGKWRK